MSQARLQRNVEVYKEATQEAFAAFVEAALFVVTTALSLTPGGPAVLAFRSIVGTVGTKLVLKDGDHSTTAFVEDVMGGGPGPSAVT